MPATDHVPRGMQQRTYHVEIHAIEDDMNVYEGIWEYASYKYNIYFNRKDCPDLRAYVGECSQHITDYPRSEFSAQIDQGVPEAFLELGIRYLSGCGMRKKSIQGALFAFDILADPFASGEFYKGDRASDTLRAQAHSGAALAYWEEWCLDSDDALAENHAELHRFGRPYDPNGEPRFNSLILAAMHATYSVQLGHESPAVLMVGIGLKNVAAQVGIDANRLEIFKPLLRVLRKREDEMLEEQRKRAERVNKDANAYVCAADGCKVGAVHKAALRSCGGRCPLDLKPHYCSKECQKRDWSRHKVICKPGRPGASPVVSDKEGTAQFLSRYVGSSQASVNSETSASDLGGEWIEGHVTSGAEHSIDVPGFGAGEQVRLVSSTLQPTELRKMREEIAEWHKEKLASGSSSRTTR